MRENGLSHTRNDTLNKVHVAATELRAAAEAEHVHNIWRGNRAKAAVRFCAALK